jgi:hypothetical protein
MTITRMEFFEHALVTAALDDYADAALDHFEDSGTQADLPNVVKFLQQRGIAELPAGPIEVHRTVGEPDHVMRPVCPDGSDGCYPKCRWVKGEYVCVWTCRCP